MLIKLINSSSVCEDLSIRIIIKAISDFIKTIKVIKKTLISRY